MISKEHHLALTRLTAENSIVMKVVVKTKYTVHLFERMSRTSDRGRWRWCAATNLIMGIDFTDSECKRSHIDDEDIFPRLYFFSKNLIEEFSQWLERRSLQIVEINVPDDSL